MYLLIFILMTIYLKSHLVKIIFNSIIKNPFYLIFRSFNLINYFQSYLLYVFGIIIGISYYFLIFTINKFLPDKYCYNLSIIESNFKLQLANLWPRYLYKSYLNQFIVNKIELKFPVFYYLNHNLIHWWIYYLIHSCLLRIQFFCLNLQFFLNNFFNH